MPTRKNAQKPKENAKESSSPSKKSAPKKAKVATTSKKQQKKEARAPPKAPPASSCLGRLVGLVVRLALLGALAVVGGVFVLYQMQKDYEEVNVDKCTVRSAYEGIEDLQFSQDWDGIMLASSDPKEYNFVQSKITPKIAQGTIIRGDFNQDPPTFERADLNLYPHDEFHPHGIYLLDKSRNPGDMSARLLVVNHRQGVEAIENFAAMNNGKTWVWTRSFTHPLFTGINDVVMINAGSMYVTNWLDAPLNYGMIGDFVLRQPSLALRPGKTVIYCTGLLADTIRCGVALDGVDPNGITSDFSGKMIYLRDGDRVDEYVKDVDGALAFIRTLSEVGTDNLNVDRDGNLLLASHISKAAAMIYFLQRDFLGTPTVASPSAITRLDPVSKETTAEVLYRGALLDQLSAADYWDGWLIGGSVYDKGVLVCDLRN